MRVLLLGGTGHVGAALAPLLAAAYELAAPSRGELDLASAGVRRRAESYRPDLVVNAAAWTDVDSAERDPAGAFAVNAGAVGELATACASVGAPLIHLSTDFVFSGELERWYREDDEVGPLNAYGRSKLAGEDAIARAGAVALVLRTSWVFGLDRPCFVSRVAARAKTDVELIAPDDQIGTPTSATELAGAIARIVGVVAPDPIGYARRFAGIYHLAGPEHASRYALSRAVLDGVRGRAGYRAERVRAVSAADLPTFAPRPLRTPLDSTKAARAFGIVLSPWRQALARLFAH